MQIIFFRHGIAADREPGGTDAARPLTDEGVAKTKRIAAGLAKLIERPAVILTSPRLRAKQTAELLGKAIDVDPRVVDELEAGNTRAVIEVVARWANEPVGDYATCVMVGHAPDLGEAVEMMIAGQLIGRIDLKKAGAACVSVTGPVAWERACGDLMWMSVPTMWK